MSVVALGKSKSVVESGALVGLSLEPRGSDWAVCAALQDGRRVDLGEYPHARAVELMCLLMTGQHPGPRLLPTIAKALAALAVAGAGVTALRR